MLSRLRNLGIPPLHFLSEAKAGSQEGGSEDPSTDWARLAMR